MTKAKETRPKSYYVWLGILVLLLGAALVTWVYELRHGLGVTGMRDVISWGIYIFTFAFFVKLSAGGLIVASSAEVFGIRALKPLARLGVLTAASSILVAGISIIPDLGKPSRILNLIIHPNWSSPLIWDVTIISCYFVLAALELWLMYHGINSFKKQKQLKVLAYIGLPAAFALHSITGWIFGLQIARPFWNSAIMAPLFVVSAILSGTALITIIIWLLQKYAGVEFAEDTWGKLRGLMAISLAIDLFFLFCEYVTILWGNVPKDILALKMILPGGNFAVLFWLEWVVGGIIPLILFAAPWIHRRVGLTAVSASLILVGVYAFQIELTTVGMANPLIQLAPGTSIGTYTPGNSVFQLVGQYAPTWVEYVIIFGLVALLALLISLGYHLLNVKESMALEGHELADKEILKGA
ncbi:NrfD/PsrC family molybdoenzyme membrane anchor subunit [Desulfosporosinus sp. FKA]|uniref:NrfD/PsrC family molybdoenzyme membrane anchor subunit n=1 Tax=Desulfosporosinus sp. FKA TaxID=1969834 RepID=UPI000B4971E3|nr:NrfD/PsrC family molybdoenzyme membrane anchor subunit [Desulfosporosinus sp. FKA]